MLINLIAFWLINVPLLYVFCFYLDFGLKGLWITMSIILITIDVCYLNLIQSKDWYEAHLESKEREQKE